MLNFPVMANLMNNTKTVAFDHSFSHYCSKAANKSVQILKPTFFRGRLFYWKQTIAQYGKLKSNNFMGYGACPPGAASVCLFLTQMRRGDSSGN
jgi:hypothetical protein